MPKRGRTMASFDEEARKEWLTGFHKRKVARRKAAEEQKSEMEADARRQARADKRRAEEETLAKLKVETYEVLAVDGAVPAADGAAAETVRDEVADDFSRRRFGAETVVVTTSFGTLSDAEDADTSILEEIAAAAPPRRPHGRPTRGDGADIAAARWGSARGRSSAGPIVRARKEKSK